MNIIYTEILDEISDSHEVTFFNYFGHYPGRIMLNIFDRSYLDLNELTNTIFGDIDERLLDGLQN